MTRWIFFVAATLPACVWAGETALSVSGSGVSGSARLLNKVQEDGSKYVRLSMNLKYDNGTTVDILQESSYTKEGEPVRMLQTTKSNGKKSSVVVTFSDEGAQVVADKGDGPKTNMVVRPQGSTSNPTEFWFSQAKPKPGTVAEYFAFRISDQAWVRAKTKFEGVKEIVTRGQRVKANLTVTGDVKAYLDDSGDPYRIELGSLILERTGG